VAFPEILLGSKFDAKGFKQAESAVTKLNSGVKNLARTFGVAFGAAALVTYSKRAIKAFADDEKAARSLSVALANTGNAFASIGVEKFIDDLQRTTGVLDDNLRPAFQTLVTATGDVTKSQKALSLALDISAATGKNLGSVSSALAKGFTGQTTALSRLGAGLSKATLASGDMDAIMADLNDKFSGQATAAVQGYSGQIALLNVALANSAEIIGKDLLDSINLISGANGIGKTTSAIENMATSIGNAVYGVASLINRLKGIYQDTFIGDLFSLFGKLPNLSTFGAAAKARAAGTPAQSPGQRKAIDKANADALKLAKTKNSLATIDNANTARKLVLTADQQALEELKKKFDVERIGLFAALNQATDEETRMRLRSLIAIRDNDTALAGKIKAELEATRAVDFLSSALYRLSAEFDMERARMAIGKLEVAATTAAIANGAAPSSSLANALRLYPDFGSEMDAARSAVGRREVANNITINATGIGDQQIASVVQNAIQELNRYGNSTTYAGAI
jgi:hypothetical protein